MKVDVILGLQWGDEGKGKVVDVLTPNYDIVARFQGGPNAGHTLEFENQKYILRSIPSGIFQQGKINIIGNGVGLIRRCLKPKWKRWNIGASIDRPIIYFEKSTPDFAHSPFARCSDGVGKR